MSKEKGDFLIERHLIQYVHTTPQPDYKEPELQTSDIQAMTPSCFSVLQYSTLQADSKGQITFPLKSH